MQKKMHSLKILPEFFNEIITGKKTFEIRKDDRGFKVGDTLVLNEIAPISGIYTGRKTVVKITYIFRGGRFGLEEGFVIMSIVKLNHS